MLKYISIFLLMISSYQELLPGKIHNNLIDEINNAESISIYFKDTLANQKGSLLLNKSNIYKINYLNRVLYCDGVSIYNYSPFDKQVIISPVEMHDVVSLEQLFLDLEKFKLIKESKVNSSQKGSLFKLILIKDDLKVELNFDLSQNLKSILIHDSGQSYYWEISNIIFHNNKNNIKIDFNLPDSVETIDLR